MTESEFLALAEESLDKIERALEQAEGENDLDVECSRSGNVMEIELAGGSKIVVNSQAAMQQIWVAAKSGGFHYKRRDGEWIDTRSGEELFAALSRIVSEQTGSQVALRG